MNKTLDSKMDKLLIRICESAGLNEPDREFSCAVMRKLQEKKPSRLNIFGLRPALAASCAAAIVILVSPFTGNLVQALGRYFKVFMPGDKTSIVQFESLPEGERSGRLKTVSITSDTNGMTVGERKRTTRNGVNNWRLETFFGSFEGSAPETDYIFPATFYSFEDAAKRVKWIKKPNYLPEGYRFEEIRAMSPNDVFAFYKSAEGPMLIYEAFVEGGTALSATNLEIEFLKVGGNDAIWMAPAKRLKWQNGDISCGIDSAGLSKDDALKVAESIK